MMPPMTRAPFPSLSITRDALVPEGTFAEAQAAFLRPDAELVTALDSALREKNIGVVAHFYMDPELQGALASCEWPHIHVSDSLVMADRAIAMAEAGVETIAVLGVDFMSENVRAMLDASGFESVPVYRVAAEPIGCSLAEAAEATAYGAYLTEASAIPRSLHVVYINTSLVTKAKAHALVPTITCTSSNVVKTVLQAASEVDGLSVFFGPDTYMGENLRHLFETLAELDDEAIAAVHPAHDRVSVTDLLSRFRHFEQGNCVVHHMFGADVVEQVRADYQDAFVTAHLEVPGEMFALGLEGQRSDTGVVGSTSNILGFITRKLDEALEQDQEGALRFILGTEAGMITPIVRSVQRALAERESDLRVEIIFPVASEAIAQTDQPGGPTDLPIVPGVMGGEGCSTAGGCATCPYMKMNSLSALMSLAERVGTGQDDKLVPLFPKKYVEMIKGRTAADLGGEPILHMRHFQKNGVMPPALVTDIESRVQEASA